jgi:hypothetical protein
MHQLGIHTHAELTALPATEVDRWRHFFSVEPAGFAAENWRAGVATSAMINIIGRIPANSQLKPSQLFPDPHIQRLTQHKSGPVSPAKMRSWAKMLKAAI